MSKKITGSRTYKFDISSLTPNEKSSLQDLTRKVISGKIALFMGAGVSLKSEAPSGKELIELIKNEFSSVDFEDVGSNLLDICQEIDDNGKRNELGDFVSRQFYGLNPDGAIQALPRHQWTVLFTTNYDDLIEKSFEQYYLNNKYDARICRPIIKGDAMYSFNKPDQIHLFKLMGDFKRLDSGESPILTRAEYNDRSRSRRNMLDILSNFIRDGAVLYIGYSFKDRIVIELIDELRKQHDNRIDDSFALVPNLERGSKIQRILMMRGIRPIPLTFEYFMELLEKESSNTASMGRSTGSISLKLKYFDILIPYRDYKEFEEYFKIIGEEELQIRRTDEGLTEEKRIERFLKGQSESWEAFEKEWDFKRDIYLYVKNRVELELSKNRPEDNDVILLLGGGGLGKSILLKRLAYELYKEGNPVIILNSYLSYFDYKLIDKFCQDINSKSEKMQNIHKVVIIFDNMEANIDNVKKMLIYLKNHSRPAIIIGAARPNEWEYSKRQWVFGDIVSQENIFNLPQKMEEDETRRLIAHLGTLLKNEEFLDDLSLWTAKAEADYESDFFSTIYGLVDPARRKLDEILWDEYKKLPSEPTKRAYEYVCLFSQYDMPLPIDMIVNPLQKSFDYSYTNFQKDIYETEAKSLMIELDGHNAGDLFYRTKNKITAQKIVEKLFDHKNRHQLELMVKRYGEILSEVKVLDKTEIDLTKSILIHYLGPNGIDHEKLSEDNLAELYDVILNKGVDDSTILHHYGLLESNRGNFEKAKDLLNRSLTSTRKYQGGSLGRESERNIYNSLGVLFSKEALNNLSDDFDGALMLFDRANSYFKISRIRDVGSPYPYHSQAFYSFKRGNYYDSIGQTEDANGYYSKSLEIINDAKESVPDHELGEILKLEAKIYSEQFGEFSTALDKILSFIEKSPHLIDGYVLVTQLIYSEIENTSKSSPRFRDLLDQALFYVEGGLNISSKNQNLLRTKYKIMRKIDPNNLDGIYKILLERYNAFEETCSELKLLFDLGVMSFELGEYKNSKSFFKELEGISFDHTYRSGIRNVAKDSNKLNKIYRGYVSAFISKKEAILLCEEIGYPISFNPLAQNRNIDKGQDVEFNIAFNYRGAFAINLRPM